MSKQTTATKAQIPTPTPEVFHPPVWLTARAVCARYGGRSLMWLHRKADDPNFPRPAYDGRNKLYFADDLDRYDQKLLATRAVKTEA
jgi:hypothetical protein